jgi:hypothetical protein
LRSYSFNMFYKMLYKKLIAFIYKVKGTLSIKRTVLSFKNTSTQFIDLSTLTVGTLQKWNVNIPCSFWAFCTSLIIRYLSAIKFCHKGL